MKHIRLIHRIPCLAAGLLVACLLGLTAPANAQIGIEKTNQLAFVDYDTVLPGWGHYGYFYSWGWPTETGQFTNGLWQAGSDYLDATYTNTAYYYITNIMMADLMTNSGAGYGTGTGGPIPAGVDGFNNLSTNLDEYILSFDARAAGMLPDQTTANAEMQAQWQASGNILQLNFNVSIPSNWTHFEFLMSDYDGLGGTPGTIPNWVEKIVNYEVFGMNWNMNFHQPEGKFGYDEDNMVFIDNIRLDMIVKTGAPPILPPITGLPIVDWNMDDKPMWGGWGGYSWSQNSYSPTFTWSPAAAGYGVGGSNAWILQMDNTLLASPNTPQWAGGGTGDNGPTDYTLFNVGDPKAYQITFDSKAQGLNPGRTDPTKCVLQLFLDAPGGNYRADFELYAAADWATKTYSLNQGSWNAGDGRLPKASFSTNYAVTGLRIQVQIENAASEWDWGYDTDNVLIVDNIKIERLYEACPPLTITVEGANKIVTWPQPNTGSAKLQTTDSLTGAWTEVVGAANPYVYTGTAPKYFRTLWVPPPQ